MGAYDKENLKKPRATIKKSKVTQDELARKQVKRRNLAEAFERLRLILPPKNLPKEELTEVEILHQTLNYIVHLSNILLK